MCIREEGEHNAILGPFEMPPIPSMHCSPLLTRPKSNSAKRVIVDLSRSHGGSVNDQVSTDAYMGSKYQLKFPIVDHIVNIIVILKGNCFLYKVDLQRAFRQLKLDPADIKCTGLHIKEKYYVDTSVAFAYRHGSLCMQRVTDAISDT